jgi:predicted ATPase
LKNKKIYFTGSHATGKSTLARHVSQTYNLPLLTEVARQILSEEELQMDSLRNNLNIVDDYQLKIFQRQIEQDNKYTNFVSDRCIIDVLAYSAQHSRILPKLLKNNVLTQCITNLKERNCFIFFVRPTKATMKEDGVREHLSWDGIIAIDAMIKLLVEMFEIKIFSINSDSIQERIKLVDAILSLQ